MSNVIEILKKISPPPTKKVQDMIAPTARKKKHGTVWTWWVKKKNEDTKLGRYKRDTDLGGVGEGGKYDQNTIYRILKELIKVILKESLITKAGEDAGKVGTLTVQKGM